MKAQFIALLATVLLFPGCATQTKEQLAAVRAAGVSSGLISKLEHGGRLGPGDIIELKQRHVNDSVALRQLERTGVNYIVDKDIVRQFRKAGVSDAVIAAAQAAGDRYAAQFHRPYGPGWYGPWWGPYPYPGYPYGPYYYGYAGPYPYYGHRHFHDGPGFYR